MGRPHQLAEAVVYYQCRWQLGAERVARVWQHNRDTGVEAADFSYRRVTNRHPNNVRDRIVGATRQRTDVDAEVTSAGASRNGQQLAVRCRQRVVRLRP